MKWQTHYNSHEFERRNEKITQPSATVPGQSYSVAEIIARNARGLTTNVGRVPIYDGDTYVPDFEKMDIHDLREYVKAVQEQKSTLLSNQDKLNKETRDEMKKSQARYKKDQEALDKLQAPPTTPGA